MRWTHDHFTLLDADRRPLPLLKCPKVRDPGKSPQRTIEMNIASGTSPKGTGSSVRARRQKSNLWGQSRSTQQVVIAQCVGLSAQSTSAVFCGVDPSR